MRGPDRRGSFSWATNNVSDRRHYQPSQLTRGGRRAAFDAGILGARSRSAGHHGGRRHGRAIAAPTAGLHFTESVLNELGTRGVRVAEITLHVGYGTFEPVRVDDVAQHHVAREWFSIPSEAEQEINQAHARGGRVVAVGTTTTRALEASVDASGNVCAGHGWADLTITPGYRFRSVDALVTNFHLPRSSLLMLVSAFAGRDLILSAYRHAVRQGYRFYSYGDCMLIV